MALEQSANLEMLIDGDILITIQDIKVNAESGKNAIDTLRGLSGFSIGSQKLTISGTLFIPAGGMEFNFFNACQVMEEHTIQVGAGDKTLRVTGQIMTSGFGQNTNAAAETDFTFMGELNPLE